MITVTDHIDICKLKERELEDDIRVPFKIISEKRLYPSIVSCVDADFIMDRMPTYFADVLFIKSDENVNIDKVIEKLSTYSIVFIEMEDNMKSNMDSPVYSTFVYLNFLPKQTFKLLNKLYHVFQKTEEEGIHLPSNEINEESFYSRLASLLPQSYVVLAFDCVLARSVYALNDYSIYNIWINPSKENLVWLSKKSIKNIGKNGQLKLF